jgi:hypothetical protein
MHLNGQHSDAETAEPFTGADARSRAAQFKRYQIQNCQNNNKEKWQFIFLLWKCIEIDSVYIIMLLLLLGKHLGINLSA